MDWTHNLATTAAGSVYVSGSFAETATFGSQVLTRSGAQDTFVAVLDSDLNIVWALHASNAPVTPDNTEGDKAGHIAASADGTVYVVGAYEGTFTFPSGEERVSNGSWDIFVQELNQQSGIIAGHLFADLDGDGNENEVGRFPTEWTGTVYVDDNNNGEREADEPLATTFGPYGAYVIVDLPVGEHIVRQEVQPGWIQTSPADSHTVSLATPGEVRGGVDFGNFVPTTQTVYSQEELGLKIKDNQGWDVWGDVSDSAQILDLDVQVDITSNSVSDLRLSLIVPDGTTVMLAYPSDLQGANLAGTTFDDEAALSIREGTAPYDGSNDASDGRYRGRDSLSVFDLQDVQGRWTLRVEDRVKNHIWSTLNAWSIIVTHAVPAPPAGVSVTPTSGLVTSENGTTASFDVVLDTQPTDDVTIGIASSDTTEGTVDKPSLTFTPGDWSVPQTVTVTGVDDALEDGDVGYSIVTAAAVSTDPGYNDLDPADVSVTNLDNEIPTGNANDIYVWDIQFDSRLRGKGGSKHDEQIVLTVRNDADANGADGGDPVLAGATVSVMVTGPDSSLPATLSGVTDSLGVFTSTWLTDLADGTYTATVDSISLGSFVWNAALGETQVTHSIPHGSGASATASVDALGLLMADLGRTPLSGGGEDDSDPVLGSLQDGRSSNAVDELFRLDGPAVDFANLLADDELFPASSKRQGKRSAVDLALEDVTDGLFDNQLAEDLTLALV